jgi:hypothetical protein
MPSLRLRLAPLGEEDRLPGDQHALLPVDHLVVVEADQPGALRDQQVLSSLGVDRELKDLDGQLPEGGPGPS